MNTYTWWRYPGDIHFKYVTKRMRIVIYNIQNRLKYFSCTLSIPTYTKCTNNFKDQFVKYTKAFCTGVSTKNYPNQRVKMLNFCISKIVGVDIQQIRYGIGSLMAQQLMTKIGQ